MEYNISDNQYQCFNNSCGFAFVPLSMARYESMNQAIEAREKESFQAGIQYIGNYSEDMMNKYFQDWKKTKEVAK